MAEFSLPLLPPRLLEQVIRKLEWPSFYRLQITCRDMEEFVRSNRNITYGIKIDGWLSDAENGRFLLCGLVPDKQVDITCLCGAELAGIGFSSRITNFDELCKVLKTSRIKARHLKFIRHSKGMSREAWISLVKILQPKRISIKRYELDWFDEILQATQLKSIDLRLEPENALYLAKKLLPRIQELEFKCGWCWEDTRIIDSFIPILQFFQSEPLLHLQKFRYYADWMKQVPPLDELLRKFSQFNPVVMDQYNSTEDDVCFKCFVDSRGTFVIFYATFVFISIEFKRQRLV